MPHPTVSKRIFHVQLWNRFARKANNKTQSLNRGQYIIQMGFMKRMGSDEAAYEGQEAFDGVVHWIERRTRRV